mmetsp:Transcript_25647/g.56186  ORF Transcript_25647/g.56186 Transcript_25647/m.56186 type:complete len:209 (-) Transcript_25647:422-1048(-)
MDTHTHADHARGGADEVQSAHAVFGAAPPISGVRTYRARGYKYPASGEYLSASTPTPSTATFTTSTPRVSPTSFQALTNPATGPAGLAGATSAVANTANSNTATNVAAIAATTTSGGASPSTATVFCTPAASRNPSSLRTEPLLVDVDSHQQARTPLQPLTYPPNPPTYPRIYLPTYVPTLLPPVPISSNVDEALQHPRQVQGGAVIM